MITPIVQAIGYDTVWFGILLMVLLETAVFTLPIGINLYVVRGIRKGCCGVMSQEPEATKQTGQQVPPC